MTGLSKDQRDALSQAYMKMLEQFPESVEGDDMENDSEVENEDEGAEVEVETPKKGGALMMAFDKMRGKK
jgi:hypothetical protein